MHSKIIHIGDSCNNRCYFCFNHGKNFETDLLRIKDSIREGFEQGCRQVVFTGQEPTLHPDIEEIISVGNRTGYDVIQLVSNARMFTYKEFTGKIVFAGMTELLVPIYGPDAELHDSVTQVPGSFDQTTRGIRNVISVSNEFQPSFHVTPVIGSVICKENVSLLPEIAAMAYNLDVEYLFFIKMIPVRENKSLGLTAIKKPLIKALEYAGERGIKIYLRGFKPVRAFIDRPDIFYENFLEQNRVLIPTGSGLKDAADNGDPK
ncbi:radical SAM protein [bacterium]